MRTVELKDAFDDEGSPVSSVALSSVSYLPPTRSGKVGRGRNQILALSVLGTLIEEHRERAARAGHASENTSVKIDEWRDRLGTKGIDRKRFFELRSKLVDAGSIVTEAGLYVRLVDAERPF
jgi:hypothetical protein